MPNTKIKQVELFGEHYDIDVANKDNSPVKDSSNVITSGAVYNVKTDLETALETERERIDTLTTDLASISLMAEKIYFDEDLVFTEPFGKYVPDDTGTVKINTASEGMTLADLFTTAYATDKVPTITPPSITFEGTNFKSYEVGTEVTVGWNFKNATAGSYLFGPDTGVTWSNHTATLNGVLKTGVSGSFEPITITDGMNLSLTGSATHSAGAVPKTALGKAYADGQITEATKSYTYSTTLKGYRNMFIGTLSNLPATMTSSHIRGESDSCIQHKYAPAGQKNAWELQVENAKRVFIALPSGRTLTEVFDTGSNTNITDVVRSKTTTVAVNGANNYEAIDYTVFYLDYAEPASANILKITIS
jgi:hypothetical protein